MAMLLALVVASPVQAQAPAQAPDQAPARAPVQPDAQDKDAPTYLEADWLSGHADLDAKLQGQAQLRRGNTTIDADQLEYYQPSDEARASGNVRVQRKGNLYEGPLLELKVETFEGFFQQPAYQFKEGEAHGEASRADFLDENHMVVHDATYTTCRRVPGPSWLPDWILRAGMIEFDNDEEVGVAHDAYVDFKGLPILPVPPISFPLSDKRKSGLLPFSIDPLNNINGMTLVQPYYWNIAPNRDATITPTFMTARGVDLGVQFRYLENAYKGDLHVNYMPSDVLSNSDRWGLSWLHNQSINTGISQLNDVALAVNINRVSDNNYWKDFASGNPLLTQRLLSGDILASWSSGNVSGTVHVLKWQTLQAADSPIVPPYDRVPQLTTRYQRINDGGLDWSLDGDYTQFQSQQSLTGQPNAQRVFGLAQISRPWLMPQGFITPKLQLHTSTYQFDSALANSELAANSTVPTFSVDAGLVFERPFQWGDSDYLQTLEPRLFYVYTPYVDQSQLPVYDTGIADFNFASIYMENAFVGHDRISDNNLLTLGLSTRFLDAGTGAQYASFGVAQRIRFEQQKVTLNTSTLPEDAGISDVLLGSSINLNRRWAFNSTTQYNPIKDQSERSTVGVRYNPGDFRVVNLNYRFQRDFSEQIDLSWQWPLNDLWGDKGQSQGYGKGEGAGRYYAVGRMNYSIDQASMVDTVLGLEYDAGCWLGRVVISRSQTSTTTAIERIMFQLELVGFSRVGIDPLGTLKQNISHYQYLRDNGSSDSDRYSNY